MCKVFILIPAPELTDTWGANSTRSEEIVNERFVSQVRLEILRVHCTLDEDTLDTPSIQAKLANLEDITDARYGGYFEPLRHLGILKKLVGLATECIVLAGRVTTDNAVVVVFMAAVMFVQEVDFTGSSGEHWHSLVLPLVWNAKGDSSVIFSGATCSTLVNDSWMRFMNFMAVRFDRRILQRGTPVLIVISGWVQVGTMSVR